MSDLAQILNQQHPLYAAEKPRWDRYRAFGEGIDTVEEKKPWLPKGQFESPEAYSLRLALSEDLGQSPMAITRIKGGVFRGAVTRDYSNDPMRDRMEQFDAQAGGRGVTVENMLEQSFEEAAKMGLSLLFVGRAPTPEAASAAQETLPFLELYRREEAYDWDVDAVTGRLNWIILRRVTSVRSGPAATRSDLTTWLVCDRMRVERYTQDGSAAPVVRADEAVHNLGVVPVVVHYGIRLGAMDGRSYVDAISRADKRRLTLESDNANSAYLHANPRLVIRTSKSWDQIAAGGRAMLLDINDKEEAKYLELDTSGMQVIRDMIADGDRRGAELSGMDPGTFAGRGDGPTARSGTAMQWAFQAAEAPTLEDLHKWVVQADVEIHEAVARYLTAGVHSPDEAVSRAVITRQKQWVFMELGELVDAYLAIREDIGSETWRKEIAKQIAARVPGNLPPETLATIMREIEAAPVRKPAEPDPVA